MSQRLRMWVHAAGTLVLALALGGWAGHSVASAKTSKASQTQAAKKKAAKSASVKSRPAPSRKVAAKRPKTKVARVTQRAPKAQAAVAASVAATVVSARTPSQAEGTGAAGAVATSDSLGLRSNAVLVIDQETHQVLFDKNASAVLPIASLTKVMTGLVITDAGLPMDEPITITEEDIDTLKGSRSRLAVGTTLTRGELMHLALMSSENRAAHALGRTFPGGVQRFVETMNVKAKLLGMADTQYVDPTGLSPRNRSSAKDLTTLASVAYDRPLIRELSTSPGYEVAAGSRMLQYRNTNQLVHNPSWDIGLQKTGYISEAGRCLLMQVTVSGRQLIMVFLDSAGKLTRLADAERVRKWLEAHPSALM